MREVVLAADRIGLQLKEVEILRGYLGLPITDLLAVQKEAALSLEDYPRAIRISIREKDIFFDRADRRSQYLRTNYPGLKPEEEWAKRGIGFKFVFKNSNQMQP